MMVPKLPFGVHTHDPCVLSPVALHQIHDDSPGAVHPGPSRRSPGNRRFGISSFPLCSPMSCHIPQCTDNRCTSTTNSIYTHRIYQKACLVNYFFTILLSGSTFSQFFFSVYSCQSHRSVPTYPKPYFPLSFADPMSFLV